MNLITALQEVSQPLDSMGARWIGEVSESHGT
jgi:hypothetical protein